MEEFKPQRASYKHEISTQEELDFLVDWIKTVFDLYPDLRGKVNGISINFTRKFVGLNQERVLSIEKVK